MYGEGIVPPLYPFRWPCNNAGVAAHAMGNVQYASWCSLGLVRCTSLLLQQELHRCVEFAYTLRLHEEVRNHATAVLGIISATLIPVMARRQ